MSINLPRRDFLHWSCGGLSTAALATLMASDARADDDKKPAALAIAPQAASPGPHHPPKARRVIHLCLCGGVSQIDSFDYKPELAKLHGKPLGGDERPDVFFGKVGLYFGVEHGDGRVADLRARLRGWGKIDLEDT